MIPTEDPIYRLALTDAGDVWLFTAHPAEFNAILLGNITTGGPTPVEGSSFGAIKGMFRDK
jgi:hypothetical protein